MNFLRNNKGVLIFYTVILIASLIIINDVKKDELRDQNRYVMTYMAN